MKLSKQTIEVLKVWSSINTNLVIPAGSKISTMSIAKDIMAVVDVSEKFAKQVSIFNLSELLGVLSSFSDPEIDLEDKYMTITEGKQSVKYVYADPTLLVSPSKAINMPKAEVSFTLSAADLARIQKMAGILAVEDLSFVGDGNKIVARVLDLKNPSGNNFDIDMDTNTKDEFVVNFKVEKIKLLPGDHKVEISSKKISKFENTTYNSTTYIAVEATSEFK